MDSQASGARRASRRAPHFLVPKEIIEAIAQARLEGDSKYGSGNWTGGDKAFFVDCLSHAIEHLYDAAFDDADSAETHLGHAACNIAFILWALKRKIITREDFRRVAEILKDFPPPSQ